MNEAQELMNLGLKRRAHKFTTGHNHNPAYWKKEDKEVGKTKELFLTECPGMRQ